jgi:peptidoglycan/LPS O-acetylase OafA/YrhL
MVTIDQKNAAAGFRPSGFDYMRMGLAIAVIAWHTILVCYGRDAETPWWTGPLRPIPYFIVPSFFALSGFLVAGSLDRNDIPSFLTLRVLRIFPALVLEVLLSGLILGALLTTLPLGEYFSSPTFWAYFRNMVGDIHFYLPGVFEANPAPQVNVQLWTVPYELECYLAITLLALIRLHRRPWLLMGILVAVCAAKFGQQVVTGNFTVADFHPPGRMIVICFLFGVALQRLQAKIPATLPFFLLAAAATWACLALPEAVYLAPLPVAYVTVYLGLLNPPHSWFTKAADYSYGLYLYGFPVQQMISFLLPDQRHWYINLVLSLIGAGLFAALSWHLAEKRVMEKKKPAILAVRGFVERIPLLRLLVAPSRSAAQA